MVSKGKRMKKKTLNEDVLNKRKYRFWMLDYMFRVSQR